ncbi:MAG: AAA family ATPase, partial [Dermatophilaceae bacterium]
VLGSPAAVTAVVDRLVTAPAETEARPHPGEVDPAVTGQVVAATTAVVAAGRATWQSWHVRAEAERQTRAHPATTTLPRAGVDTLVEQVVAAVLAPAVSVALSREDPADLAAGGTPAPLRRADGTSVYEVAGSRLYTSETILAAEQVIVNAAARVDGHRIGDTHVDVALLEALANGVALNDAQAHLVRALATCGARVQVAIAPAGSGKTTALATLTRAWTAAGATIVGLAPSAAAASVLAENITPSRGPAPHTDTVAKLVWHLTHDTPNSSPTGFAASTRGH